MLKLFTILALLMTTNVYALGPITTGGDGTSKVRNSTPTATDRGTPLLGIRNDANAAMSGADGRYTPLTTDSTGRLRTDATISEVATGADGAAAPALGKMAAGLDSGGNLQYMSVDTNGELQVDILALPGGLRGYAEDTAHASGDLGVGLFAVRNDAGTALAADGDYHLLTVDSTGRLRVDAAITEAATAADGGALPALTKVTSGYDGTNVRTLHTDAAGDLQVDMASALPAGTNNIGDVDLASAIPAGNNNIGDVDVASIAAGDNNIGNVDVLTLPALPAGTNNIGDVDVLSLPSIPAGTNNIGDVDLASAIPAGTNNIGKVDMAARVRSTNNTFTNAALADLDQQQGTSENVEAYQTADVTFTSSKDLIVDIEQSQDGAAWNIIDSYDVPANFGRKFTVKLVARFFRVTVNNMGPGTANLAVTTYFNQTGETISSSVVEVSASGNGTARVRTSSSQLPTALGQTTMANSLSVAIASNQSAIPVSGTVTVGQLDVVDQLDANVLDTSSTNINGSAGAFVQVVASTASAVKALRIADTTGEFIGIYTGAAASETLKAIIEPGMADTLPATIAAGTRITLRSMGSSTISTGKITIQFLN